MLATKTFKLVPRLAAVLCAQRSDTISPRVRLARAEHEHRLIVLDCDIAELTLQADIVVSALGVPGFLRADMVKEGAIVVDVGITRVPDASREKGYYISGDVDYENVLPKASYITPVPGGVGPMTIAMLLKNTLLARQRHQLRNCQ